MAMDNIRYKFLRQLLFLICNIIFISKHGDGDPSKAYQVIKNTLLSIYLLKMLLNTPLVVVLSRPRLCVVS